MVSGIIKSRIENIFPRSMLLSTIEMTSKCSKRSVKPRAAPEFWTMWRHFYRKLLQICQDDNDNGVDYGDDNDDDDDDDNDSNGDVPCMMMVMMMTITMVVIVVIKLVWMFLTWLSWL